MRTTTRLAALAATACLALSAGAGAATATPKAAHADNGVFRFGVVTDAQYCDCDTPATSTRYYRDAPAKLATAIDTLNSSDVEFSVQMGDLIDKNMSSFDTMVPLWNTVDAPRYSLLGNHDFPVNDVKTIVDRIGMKSNYYDFSEKNWRFIMLDTNDVSTYANAPGSADYVAAEEAIAELKAEGAPNAQTWNGGVGERQLAWLEGVLADSRAKNQRVIVFSHHPLFGVNMHNAFDAPAVQALLEQSGNVVAAFNGHDHAGRYAQVNGIHYLNMKGMVEQPFPANSYAVVTVQNSKLRVNGYGLEPDRTLTVEKR